jgi:hypothetical protein
MADVTYHLAALAGPSPRPLPAGTNDYGPLAYLVWVVGGLLLLTVLYFAVRALLRSASRRRRRSHERGNA